MLVAEVLAVAEESASSPPLVRKYTPVTAAALQREMGRIAAELADLVVITDDNPRDEDPDLIRATIAAGAADGSAEVVVIGDRRAAIDHAVGWARAGDTVLVAKNGGAVDDILGQKDCPANVVIVARVDHVDHFDIKRVVLVGEASAG